MEDSRQDGQDAPSSMTGRMPVFRGSSAVRAMPGSLADLGNQAAVVAADRYKRTEPPEEDFEIQGVARAFLSQEAVSRVSDEQLAEVLHGFQELKEPGLSEAHRLLIARCLIEI